MILAMQKAVLAGVMVLIASAWTPATSWAEAPVLDASTGGTAVTSETESATRVQANLAEGGVESYAHTAPYGSTDGTYTIAMREVSIANDNAASEQQQAVYASAAAPVLPRDADWQQALYSWLKTVTVNDVTISHKAMTWDGTYRNVDELADLWLMVEGATASSVTRGEPEWYVLDAGNGKGIEATGVVRVWHQPKGGNYRGNPPRSWSQEPAFLTQIDLPLSGGGQGNPYYQGSADADALCHRSMVVSMVDMMMYRAAPGGYDGWFDMFGKAFLGWAEAYRWCGSILPAEARNAYEEGMEHYLDKGIAVGPRAVNTNMDMFFLQGAADFYMATSDPTRRKKCVQLARRALFGYTDGVLDTKHRVFKLNGIDGGVMHPAGFIMEGDQADIFYGGESIYHLAGALSAVMDRATGSIDGQWTWLKPVLERLQDWRTYQLFYEPGQALNNQPPKNYVRYQSGAGMTGRTGYGVPKGQADEVWKHLFLADVIDPHTVRIKKKDHPSHLPTDGDMVHDIRQSINNGELSKLTSTYEGAPKEWSGWSPWTMPSPYLPPKGWYSRLRTLVNADNPSTYPPVYRKGTYYSKAFGGGSEPNSYWAYKDTDGSREFGFFVETQARQGTYGGWYGGKIETFWTEATGAVLVNRHGKGGCDGKTEDSVCWDNLDYRAAHHVWGRDENGNGFTTTLVRGQRQTREPSYDLGAATPFAELTTTFNDPSLKANGEQNNSLEGTVSVKRRFEALANGIRVKETVTSDGTDKVTELYATIPVHLRMVSPLVRGDQPQAGLDDTTIEYWNGTTWRPLPEDGGDADNLPDFVTTTKLRLGRDFLLGDGPQYVYVGFQSDQKVRLGSQIYYDPYQTRTSVRAVHFDLHGSPGTVRAMPTSTSLTYTITTTETATESSKNTSVTQTIPLTAGWNMMGGFVQPSNAALEQVLADVLPLIAIVKDEQGRIFSPEFDIDAIETWQPSEAYQVYAREAVSLQVRGTPLTPSNTPIELKAGWNLIPFIGASTLPVGDALQSIRDAMVVLKDNQGNLYYPDAGLDQVTKLRPGQGYKIYVTRDATLYYPE